MKYLSPADFPECIAGARGGQAKRDVRQHATAAVGAASRFPEEALGRAGNWGQPSRRRSDRRSDLWLGELAHPIPSMPSQID